MFFFLHNPDKVGSVLRTGLGKLRLCVKQRSLETSFLRMGEYADGEMIKRSTGDPAFISATILQTVACGGISSPRPLPPSHPTSSRSLSPPSSSALRSSLFGRLAVHRWHSTRLLFDTTRDSITGVLMSRLVNRLTKWSYRANSAAGTNSWFWRRHLCHLQ